MTLESNQQYHIRFSKAALHSLKKMDRYQAKVITSWLRKNIEGTTNPYQHGKALTANHIGEWRYRVGDYRVICRIDGEELVVLALTIGHRRDVYDD
ncbi:type II toxin-antitoxin system RelE family toxin [Furfurilactobacillus siliginis]|uniref:Cytotoxic translational repressor of toxin-antitoxin stability system n=1 Tax=Furfurilactobacillus siliginis TaxID=348151 RepID=A0A0R2L3Q4_9LACO|nr:type II toxin-antitoxin system RelE/ParE family toxin [Furfurilactobacillus siliginis]KRN96064.1 hypothetical protein IV55_GL001747 [Furfurilactobacillus siliginis]GEK28770.1 cytotoxic translational repressor of toxin-antitoxin stability system [Furfurilactobacillus siliginis]